jgi:hypothetical protein
VQWLYCTFFVFYLKKISNITEIPSFRLSAKSHANCLKSHPHHQLPNPTLRRHHHNLKTQITLRGPLAQRVKKNGFKSESGELVSVNGFSVHLTPTRAVQLARVPGVLSVILDQARQLHTTRTPQFLGLADNSGIWPNSEYAEDVIIGVLDTSIWSERLSFSDTGLSSVPTAWKGVCETGHNFPASACNRKIIGARAFHKGYEFFL